MPVERLFAKPYGPSELFERFDSIGIGGGDINEGVVCGLCGTLSDESEALFLFSFAGRQGIVSCCGRIMDEIYEDYGENFTMQYLRDYSMNPIDSKFNKFLEIIHNSLVVARNRALDAANSIRKVLCSADDGAVIKEE